MRFLYLKLGRGNCQAEYWLQQGEGENVFNRPAVAIFFRKTTTEECKKFIAMRKEELDSLRKFRSHEHIPSDTNLQHQIKPFIEAGDSGNVKFVTIITQRGLVYVYEPDSQVFDMPEEKYDEYDSHLSKLGIRKEEDKKTIDEHFPKVMFVKNIRRFTEFPHVLATLSCSQYLIRGTCREISPDRNWGAIQAIRCCLGEPMKKPKTDEQRLRLLSWHQLETLVFLLLKNAAVHPSAWRGGTLPEIDIVATNFNDERVKIGTNPQIVFEPMKRKTFQIKRGRVRKPVKNADYTIAIDFRGEKNKKILTSRWVLEQIEAQPDTKDWFEKSLHWTCR